MMKLTVQGRSAAVYTGGKPFDPALPCIAFVHGALHDHSVWTLLSRWFAHHGLGVLAVDLPGHGGSEGPALPSVEAAADWLLALMDAAGVRQAALAGHSMGSLIALEATARAPARITRLVMIGTANPMKVSDALLATAREQPLKAIDMVNAFSISTHAAKPSYPGPGMWLHGSNRALMRRTLRAGGSIDGRNLFEHDFRVCDAYAGGLAAAARLQCPVTMILGQADQMTPPKATRELTAALKARVVMLDSGHHLMAEQPDAMLAAVRAALA
jgi:pimeloyl-ACP methyl ester carboxylesterase